MEHFFLGTYLYDWDDVVLPDMRSEEFNWDGIRTNFQGFHSITADSIRTVS